MITAVAPAPNGAAPLTTPAAPGSTPAPAAAPAPQTRESIQAKIAAEQQKRQGEAQRKELEALRTEAKALRDWKASLITNPENIKDVLGDKAYDILTDRQLNGDRLTPEQVDAKLEAKLRERDEKAKADKAAADAAGKAEADETRQAWVDDLTAFVAAEPTKYRLIALHGAAANVAAHIEHNYKTTGKLMSDAEGADSLEASIRKAVLDSVDGPMLDEILKSRQGNSPSTRAVQQQSALHNGLTSTTPSAPRKLLTRDERRQAAFEKFDRERGQKAG